jgi:hypothetical protein
MPTSNDLPRPKPQKIDTDFRRPSPKCPPLRGPAQSKYIDGFYSEPWLRTYLSPYSQDEVQATNEGH